MDRNLPSVLTHCGCILLAGGGSKRLGRPKQLLRFEGQTLIRRAACLALEAGYSPVVAVLGSHAEQIAPELEDLEAQVALNADWQAGMSSSLAAGLARVVSMDPDVSHTLVMVCDQIHVTAETLRELRYRSAFKPSNIVASKYAGVVGVPAIFPKDFFPLLLTLSGDKGARSLLQQFSGEVDEVSFSGGSIDIDTLEDARGAGLL